MKSEVKMMFKALSVFLLFFATLFSGCGKNERIVGKVQDVFANPLADVTVKIQKSTFSAKTDNSGSYSLDYAPGSMKLIFSKTGYTTHILDLDIQQKSYFPAEIITLYPIPQENGLYYIDTEKKQLLKLEENGIVEEFKSQYRWSMSWNCRYFVFGSSKSVASIKPGKIMFIDRIPYFIMLSTLKKDGLIYQGDLSMASRSDKYSGFIKEKILRVGEENLLIRTFELSHGSYAWVHMFKNELIGAIPKKGGLALRLQVEEPTDEEKRSDQILK